MSGVLSHRESGISIDIDRGGAFMDVWASIPGRVDDLIFKLLFYDPANYPGAPTEGIRRVLEAATRNTMPRGELLSLSLISSIRMGTAVSTNASLERKGESSAILITTGFPDLLSIGNQARPDISISRLRSLVFYMIEVLI